MQDTSKYQSSYSEKGLWDKIKKYSKAAGKGVVFNALKLYYAMALGKATPQQIVIIIGALGYFISPIDAYSAPAPPSRGMMQASLLLQSICCHVVLTWKLLPPLRINCPNGLIDIV